MNLLIRVVFLDNYTLTGIMNLQCNGLFERIIKTKTYCRVFVCHRDTKQFGYVVKLVRNTFRERCSLQHGDRRITGLIHKKSAACGQRNYCEPFSNLYLCSYRQHYIHKVAADGGQHINHLDHAFLDPFENLLGPLAPKYVFKLIRASLPVNKGNP